MELDTIVCGDCLDVMADMPNESVDVIITDPPYPYIKRDYGYWTGAEWWALMMGVCVEARRILKPNGSAVFILQPNSEKSGKLRGWLWEFMSWVCREWNMIQDVWWWNFTAMPTGGCTIKGLLRPSIKACVWCGPFDCFRNQEAVLWQESDDAKYRRKIRRARRDIYDKRTLHPSGSSFNLYHCHDAAEKRGGTTPFNLIPAQHDGWRKAGDNHGAPTPTELVDWWIRYITPIGGIVFDPFIGSGTVAVAALKLGRHFYGCDINSDSIRSANEWIEKAKSEIAQLSFGFAQP